MNENYIKKGGQDNDWIEEEEKEKEEKKKEKEDEGEE